MYLCSNFTADRAKQIKTVASVNEDPTEKLIRELQNSTSPPAEPPLPAPAALHPPQYTEYCLIVTADRAKQIKTLPYYPTEYYPSPAPAALHPPHNILSIALLLQLTELSRSRRSRLLTRIRPRN